MKNNKANVGMAAAFDLPGVVSGEHKLKSLGSLITNLIAGTQIWNYQLGKLWLGMGKGIKSAITSIGALQAAMNKLKSTEAASKQFKAMAGSAANVRSEIERLLKLSASKDMRFEEVAAATVNLVSLSRGAMGSVKSMEELIDASKATGASLGDLADAVGGVSEALRNGQSIDSMVDRLRSLGAITDSAASSLKAMQGYGAGAAAIQSSISSAMSKQAGRGKGDGAAESEKASEAAKAGALKGVGAPWLKGDIETTKNYTEALKALAPALADISQFFATLFSKAASVFSWFVKLAAQFGVIGFALRGTAALVSVLAMWFGTLANIKMLQWLQGTSGAFRTLDTGMKRAAISMMNFGLSAKGATNALVAMRATVMLVRVALIMLQVASVVAVLFGLLATAAQVFSTNTSKLNDEIVDSAKAFADLNEELLAQISHIDTLADKHAVLQSVLKKTAEMEAEAAKLQAEYDQIHADELPEANEIRGQRASQLRVQKDQLNKVAIKAMGAPTSELGKKEFARHRYESQLTTRSEVEKSRQSDSGKIEEEDRAIRRLREKGAQGVNEVDAGRATDLELDKINSERQQFAKKYGMGADQSEFDRREMKVKMASGSLIQRGAGQLQAAELAAGGKILGKDGKPISQQDIVALRDKGRQNQNKGNELKDSAISNISEATTREEENRKRKIALGLEVDLLEAHEEYVGSLKTGHDAYLEQHNEKMKGIEAEIEARKKEMKSATEAEKEADPAIRKGRQKAKDAEANKALEEEQHQQRLRHAASAKKLAEDGSVGIPRAQKERAQEIEDIGKDIEAEKKKGAAANKERIDEMQTAQDEARRKDRLATVEETKQQLATGRDIQNRHAAATGDASTIQKNQAVSEFQDVYDSVLEATGNSATAEALGRRAAQDSVNLQGIQMQQAANTSGAVSSLARIGGGGGAEAVDTQIDLMKQSRDIQQTISNTLIVIRDAKKGINQ